MLVSLKWLRDYVDPGVPPEELAERLTMAGLEVDSATVEPRSLGSGRADRFAAASSSRSSFPAGFRPMPLFRSFAGDEHPCRISAAGNGRRSCQQASAPIRGEASEDALPEEEERGRHVDHDSSRPSAGEGTGDALTCPIRFWISARHRTGRIACPLSASPEVAAVTGKALRYPSLTVKESDEDIRGLTSVSIDDPDLCPRYTARVIRNVRIAPSPFWMRRRLEAVGLRSINNVVDVTNFVMMELGQPLHAFDFRFLEQGRIVVRRSRAGEIFVSLDEKERVLQPDTLMICDGVKPVAIGGVMGGLNSEIQNDTEMILLESAYFDPASIRRTARALGMGTDAAFRFERGIDPRADPALDRAAV